MGDDGSPPPPGSANSDGGMVQVSPLAVGLAALMLLINAAVSLKFKLGLHAQLAVASCRMVAQLSVLGYLLVPIFRLNRWWLVLLYACFMLAVASLDAVQRPAYSFKGMLQHTVCAIASSSGLLLVYAVAVVLALRPVWDAQYVIPMLGMIMGNATSAISVGLTTVLEELATNRSVIEYHLAMGASRTEATESVIRRAVKLSMTPLLNQMSVMGIVSIPGMMTGQILAGGDPAQAARYQMIIMFIIGAATCIAAVVSVYLAVFNIVDATHTFQPERLVKKSAAAGPATAASRALALARRKLAGLGSCLAASCCCCFVELAVAVRGGVSVHGSAAGRGLTRLHQRGSGRASAATQQQQVSLLSAGGGGANGISAGGWRAWVPWSGTTRPLAVAGARAPGSAGSSVLTAYEGVLSSPGSYGMRAELDVEDAADSGRVLTEPLLAQPQQPSSGFAEPGAVPRR